MLDSQKKKTKKPKVLIFQAKVTVKHCTPVFVLETVVFNFQVGGTKWAQCLTPHAIQDRKRNTATPRVIAIADLKNYSIYLVP